MQVAQVIDSLHWGGVQALQVTLAEMAQRKKDLRLTVVSLRSAESTPYPYRLAALNVQVVYFPAPKLLDPSRIGKLASFFQREGFDLVHTHLPYANILGTMAARIQKIPVVNTLHLTGIDPHPIRRRLEAWAMRCDQAVIAVGESVAAVHQPRCGFKKIVILPNPAPFLPEIPAHERIRVRQELIGGITAPVIISVGRLSPEKGYPDLIQSAAFLKGFGQPFQLLIVGGGSQQPALQQQIERLNLSRQVTLLGARQDVPSLLAAADIYVSSSVSMEAMSISILEAMQSGLPVVATDIGENSHLVVEDTGIIVPRHDPMAFAEAIQSLLVQPELRDQFGCAAKAHVARSFSREVWYERLISIYRSLKNN